MGLEGIKHVNMQTTCARLSAVSEVGVQLSELESGMCHDMPRISKYRRKRRRSKWIALKAGEGW
jgi:hypothetical protein